MAKIKSRKKRERWLMMENNQHGCHTCGGRHMLITTKNHGNYIGCVNLKCAEYFQDSGKATYKYNGKPNLP